MIATSSASNLAARLRILALCLTAISTFAVGTLSAQTQQAPTPEHKGSAATISSSESSAETAATHTWTNEQILTCTVSDAWQLGGRNEEGFFDIVQVLAEISAQHRGLVLPDNAEAGRKAGELIKQKARADRGQLLYGVVDAAVRKLGTKAPTN
jgi:hypothetical protein